MTRSRVTCPDPPGAAETSAARLTEIGVACEADRRPLANRPECSDHSLVTISGPACERSRTYGRNLATAIREFLNVQICSVFVEDSARRDEMLRYAGACLKPMRQLSPELIDELEGMAEGSELQLEEHVLLTLHEELWHCGVVPSVDHWTAVAVGPSDTCDGKTYVAQSWHWMPEGYGKFQMLLWKREDTPS